MVTSSLLVAGCGSAPTHRPASPSGAAAASPGRGHETERAAARVAEAHARYAAGVIHEMNDELPAATEDYYQAALLDPDDETLILEVSRRLLQNRQGQRALEIVSHAAARPNASGQIYARLGLIYSQLGKPDQAAAANRMAIKKSPGLLAGYQNLYLGYVRNKQPQEALKVLDEAARQPRTDAEFLISLAELYTTLGAQVPAQKAGANAKALALLRRAGALEPLTPLLRLRLADGFNLLGASTEAARFYLEVLKQPPDLPLIDERIRASLTEIYLRGSDHKRAVEQLRGIIRDDPTNPQAYFFLGRLALEDKNLTEAVDDFRRALVLSPDLEPAYYFLAMAQIGLNKPDDALATLEKARQKFSQNFALEFYTGLAYSRQKAYGDALRHFVAAEIIARATDPKLLDDSFYFQVGATCERKGDYDQAEKYFEKCLQLAPESAEAMNYLGYMWAEHGLKLTRARELIEKAVRAEPRNAAYLDSLAWVLFKQNQPKAALPYALKAVEMSEEPDATVYEHLGDIYAALDQPDKARAAWRKSLSLEPNEAVRKKLEAGGSK